MRYGFQKESDINFPPIVHVETTNICNLKCIHCPHNDIMNCIPDYKPQSISFELWKKIVDEVSQYPVALRLTPDGEPMIVSDWVNQIQYLIDKKIDIFSFNTNGTLLSDDKLYVLLQESQTKIAIEISLDALFKDTYESIRKGSDYIIVMKNILNLLFEIKKRKIKNIKVMVSIVIQPEVDEKEVEQFKRFWEHLVDKVIIRNYVDTKGLTPSKPKPESEVIQRWPCLVPFTRMVVTYDGGIRFCPDDWKKETTIGNLNQQSISEVWHGAILNSIRQKHLNCDFNDAHQTCTFCNDWQVIKWGYDYTFVLNSLFKV